MWRRQPQQLQSTLAFMLGKDEGRLYRVPTAEFEVVQKSDMIHLQSFESVDSAEHILDSGIFHVVVLTLDIQNVYVID